MLPKKLKLRQLFRWTQRNSAHSVKNLCKQKDIKKGGVIHLFLLNAIAIYTGISGNDHGAR